MESSDKIDSLLPPKKIVTSKEVGVVPKKKTTNTKFDDFKSIDEIMSSNLKEDDRQEALISLFKRSKRYKKLQAAFTEEDLEYFIDLWAVYHNEFEDMTVAEEDALDVMITFKMRIHENQKILKQLIHREAMFREKLGLGPNDDLDIDPEEPKEMAYHELVRTNNEQKLALNEDLKDLSERFEKAQRSLHATREQREKAADVGADTFLTLVRSFNDRDVRNEAFKYNERMKLATAKKKEKMKESHEFVDGWNPIILDGSDYRNANKDVKNEE